MSVYSNPILITGAAGFIGFYVAKQLLEEGHSVVGIDNLNDYYDPNLKLRRLEILREHENFTFEKADLVDAFAIEKLFSEHQFRFVVNLAAQAGVRYSIENPRAYVDSNVTGFLNIIEASKRYEIEHLVYASTSSVYGSNKKLPFSVEDNVDHPVSIYAATKKCNELIAHAYSHLFSLPTTGLRFFTVYGPWGRPDMAFFKFARAIVEGEPIDVYNYGHMKRDFTYVDDVAKGVTKVLFQPAKPDPNWDSNHQASSSHAPYRIYNIGNCTSVELLYAIELLENEFGLQAKKNFLPMQGGDVEATFADIDALKKAVGFHPTTPLEIGLKNFVAWFKGYYNK